MIDKKTINRMEFINIFGKDGSGLIAPYYLFPPSVDNGPILNTLQRAPYILSHK